MTVTNGYCTRTALKSYLNIPDPNDDPQLDDAINAASRAIDGYCGQIFYAASSTARVYPATSWWDLEIDECSAVASVKTDEDADGSFETTWSASDYELLPASGTWDGIDGGGPYRVVHAVGTRLFPITFTPMMRRARVQVTATWGWSSVPEPVRQACLQVAAEVWKRREAPFGIAQTADFGPIRIGSDAVRGVQSLLDPYRRGIQKIAVG